MSSPIAPIRPARLVKREAKAEREGGTMVRVTVDVAAPAPTVPAAALASPSGTEAHLIAQSARTRGLRGGVKVLEGARAAYLQTEWSGSSDRRMPAGGVAKTEA